MLLAAALSQRAVNSGGAPDALVLADARPTALLASAPFALVRTDARPNALFACAPSALVLAYARAPALLALALRRGGRETLKLISKGGRCLFPRLYYAIRNVG